MKNRVESLAVAALLVGVGGGCILPIATGTPQAATTVGKGKFGFAIAEEGPVLNAVAADNGNINTAVAPAGTGTATLSLGLGDDTDIELSADVALYFFILPLPTGGSAGIRQHLFRGDNYDVAVAARIGGASAEAESTDSQGKTTTDSASAKYASLSAVVQGHYGKVRPLVSANLMPMQITYNGTYNGLSASATLGLMFQLGPMQVGPYVTGTMFQSDVFTSNFFPSGGLMMAYHPDRYNQPAAPPAQQYAPPPVYAPAPPPVYVPPPTDPAVPPPVNMPAPAPAQP
jgi:hypothetical protein